MLIWIKAPRVAIGVLASFILLLSTVVSEQVELNQTSAGSEAAASAGTDSESLQIMSLPFAHSLTNPCSWVRPFNRSSYVSPKGHRETLIAEFYQEVSRKARINKQDAFIILQNHTIMGCSSLHVHNLPHTPTLEELEELSVDAALNKIYLSLLVHSAYSYFIHHQFQSSNIRCSHNYNGEENLANQSLKMAMKQKSLACFVRVGMAVLDYEQEDVLPFLNDTISDLSQCSKRALRDCQVMKSMNYVLDLVSVYATRVVSESSTTGSPATTPSR